MSDDVFKKLPPEARVLGAPLAYFPNHPGRCLRGSVRDLFLMAFIAAACFLIAGYVLLLAIERDRADYLLGVAMTAGFGSLAVIAVALALRPVLRSAHVRGVATFADGIAGLTGDGVIVIGWTDVEEVRDRGRTVRTRDGRTLQLPNSIDSCIQLADLIFRSTYVPLSQAAEASVASSESVTFGPIAIRNTGLYIAGTMLAWDSVGNLDIKEECLLIGRKGTPRPLFRVPLAPLPNWHVLWGMIERRIETASGLETAKSLPANEPETAVQVAGFVLPAAISETNRTAPEVERTGEAASRLSDGQPLAEGQVLQPLAAREYTARRQGRPALWLMLALVVLSPVVMLIGLRMARAEVSSAYQQPDTRVFLLGAGMLTVGVICGVRLIFAQNVRVRVSPDGVTYRSPGRVVICRWEEIEEHQWEERPRQGGPSPLVPTRLYHLRCRDGRHITLDNCMGEFDALVSHVQQESARVLLPGLIERLGAGEILHFGPFAVTQAGVICNGMTLDWEEVTGADASGGTVSLFRRESWLSWGNVPLARVPNGYLLVGLARQVRKFTGGCEELSS